MDDDQQTEPVTGHESRPQAARDIVAAVARSRGAMADALRRALDRLAERGG